MEKVFDRLTLDYMAAVLWRLPTPVHHGPICKTNSMCTSRWPPVKRLLYSQRHRTRLLSVVVTVCAYIETLPTPPLKKQWYTEPNSHESHLQNMPMIFYYSSQTAIPRSVIYWKTSYSFITSQILKLTSVNPMPKPSIITQCQTNFSFSWKQDAITYLGIQLPNYLSDLYSKTVLLVLRTVMEDLCRWDKPFFSWFGKAAILKMNVLPRLLYLLHAIPIRLPSSFFRS